MEDPSLEVTHDILDCLGPGFGPSVKMFSCALCSEKFSNKKKITIHWAVNHGYSLCSLCSNYAFRFDSDRLQHEMQHFPFACSSCDHEFNTVRHDVISQHYKLEHNSFLCMYCSSVIDPYSMSSEHFEKKHNVSVKSHAAVENSILFELIGDLNGHFHCQLCDKRKPISQMFGHYCHYHNLSIQSLKSFLDSSGLGIRINGSSLSSLGPSESGGEVCNVCEKPINADSSIHDVFCQGFVVCDQKDCDKLFEDKAAMESHLQEHPISNCRFGCSETKLKPTNVKEHELLLHGIQECSLCDLINSSGNMKNHLREKHNVNLMTYEKAVTQTSSKLYRLSTKGKQVFCNFCDIDITKWIRSCDFSFLNHYQFEHEIKVPAIIRNLDKNPIIDIVMNDKKSKNEEDCLKNFTVIVEKSTEELVVIDFDCSKVFCVAADGHSELKPRLPGLDLSNRTSLECEFCNDSSFDASCRLYEHLNQSHGFKLLNVGDECNTCHTVLPSSKDDEEDKKTFNLSLVCPIDSSLHVTKENFRNHVWEQHDGDSTRIDRIIYKCFECNFAYKHLSEMRCHFAEAHPELILTYCKLCRYKLNSPSESSQHFNLNHASEIKSVEKLSCKLCQKDFNKKSKAKIHYETAHKKDCLKKSFKCQFQLCNEAFENKEDRKMHQMIAHPDEKLFGCKSCPLKFSTKSSLSSHNLIHKNVLNTCEFCGKTFIRRDSYKEHLLIHSGVRQKCSFCEKSFVQRSNLVRHERIHLNEKPYACSYCEKTFSDKGACTSHEKVHTKSESSFCTVCGKHFARKQKLKYHMRIHTLENVLRCECGKIFTESYSFRKHKETHLKNSRKDKCEWCGKLVKSAKAMQLHLSTFHSCEPSPCPDGESNKNPIETNIQCPLLCSSADLTLESMKDHLRDVHSIEEPEFPVVKLEVDDS